MSQTPKSIIKFFYIYDNSGFWNISGPISGCTSALCLEPCAIGHFFSSIKLIYSPVQNLFEKKCFYIILTHIFSFSILHPFYDFIIYVYP